MSHLGTAVQDVERECGRSSIQCPTKRSEGLLADISVADIAYRQRQTLDELLFCSWRRMLIDTSFDFRTDASGKDPDAYSPTLRLYHKLLWSKVLPSGRLFDLDDTVRGVYLYHGSELGEFFLSSDSVIPTFTRWDSMRHITELFTEEENEAFRTIGYTIGGMMVFPGNRIDGKQTINGARGFNRKIADRFDLTLECIRRHYLGQRSPLDRNAGEVPRLFRVVRGLQGLRRILHAAGPGYRRLLRGEVLHAVR